MFERLGRFGMKIARFMQGRNGIDKLSIFLFVLGLVVNSVNYFIPELKPSLVLGAAAYALFGWALFRALSKNRMKRMRENVRFLNLVKAFGLQNAGRRVRGWFDRLSLRVKYAGSHRFRRCPHCGETLRLSKKRGRRVFPCPKCGEEVRVWIVF